MGAGDWDHSQSYLASSWAAAGGALRETAITSMGGVHEDDEIRNRISASSRGMLARRSSDGEAWPSAASASSLSSVVTRSPSSTREKRHALRKHRKSRSWHPSPYVSEEEDEEEEDSLSREEKKARIKAEIARRRQQIQERAGIHGDMISTLPSRIHGGSGGGSGAHGIEHERHSVLKSVDQLLRDQYGRFDSPASSPSAMYGGGGRSSLYHHQAGGATSLTHHPGGYATISSSRPSSHHHHHHHHYDQQQHQLQHQLQQLHGRIGPGGQIISPSASEEDRSIERIASTFRNDPHGLHAHHHPPSHHHHTHTHDYASMLYDRLGMDVMSPLATDSESMGSELGAPAAMPLLPDMPTRSRRLLEDLGSAPMLGLASNDQGPVRVGGAAASSSSAAGQSIKGKYGVSAQGLNLPFRTVM